MAQNLNNCTITLSGDIFNNSKSKRSLESKFTGTPGKFFFLKLGVLLLSIIPFVGLPNAMCIYQRWVCKHTLGVGVPLQFVGRPGPLLKEIIKWFFFSIITLGVYALILLPVRVEQWRVSNTVFGPVAGA